MQFIKKLPFTVLFVTLSAIAFAQSDRISLGDKQYQLLNRLDIKLQNDSVLSFSTVKPYNRKVYTERIALLDSLDQAAELPAELSSVDRYNIQSLLMNKSDWSKYRVETFHMEYFF